MNSTYKVFSSIEERHEDDHGDVTIQHHPCQPVRDFSSLPDAQRFINDCSALAGLLVDALAALNEIPNTPLSGKYPDSYAVCSAIDKRLQRASWQSDGLFKDMLYDGYELQMVAEYPDPNGGTFCEPVLDVEYSDDNAIRQFWTVYGHLPSGGVEAIADKDDQCDALKLYNHLTRLHSALEGCV